MKTTTLVPIRRRLMQAMSQKLKTLKLKWLISKFVSSAKTVEKIEKIILIRLYAVKKFLKFNTKQDTLHKLQNSNTHRMLQLLIL